MLKPIRCFSCGKVMPHVAYENQLKKGIPPKKIMDDLNLTRQCCRTVVMTSVELYDEMSQYQNNLPNKVRKIPKTITREFKAV